MAESGSDNSFHLTSLIKSPFLLVQSLCRPERVGIKFQTFLIHERHGWPRRTGSGTRFTRQMQTIKQTNVKTITLITNADRIIHLKMSFKHLREALFFLRRKQVFRRRISFFVWRILFEEPRIWTFGFNLRTRVLKSVTATQERLDMRSGCHAAKILPVGVRGTGNVWRLSSLVFDSPWPRFWKRNIFFLRNLTDFGKTENQRCA